MPYYEFAFLSAATGRRSTRSVGEEVLGDDPRGRGEEELFSRERMVQIVELLSEMDEHILGLYDPALVARYERMGGMSETKLK